MVRHMVLTKLRPDVPEARIAEVYEGLADLTDSLSGAGGFLGGRSDSPERMERGYTHAFTIDFESWAALKAYADDPRHKELGAELVTCAEGGLEGLLVLDLDLPG